LVALLTAAVVIFTSMITMHISLILLYPYVLMLEIIHSKIPSVIITAGNHSDDRMVNRTGDPVLIKNWVLKQK